MKFYSLNVELWNSADPNRKVYPRLRGDKIIEGRNLFIEKKIYMESYVDDAPIFDYFTMVEGGNYKKEDDWILLDVYSFIGYKVPIQIHGFAVSQKFKNILERFNVETPYKFYPCKLKYKGEKIDFFIFQIATNIFEKVNFPQSQFSIKNISGEIEIFKDKITDKEGFFEKMLEETKSKNGDLFISKGHLYNHYDFFKFYVAGNTISERLKNAIEEAGITGVKMEPIDDITFEFENGIPELL